MLIAYNHDDERTLAAKDTPDGPYTCPECTSEVILKKRGRKVAAHFAHRPGANCTAEGESWRHLLAKKVLAEEFTRLGYTAEIEVSHRTQGRRVDVVVSRIDSQGNTRKVAVEIQDSAIQVEEAKDRLIRDRRLGYDATVWLFTSNRASTLLIADDDDEVRVPAEMLWVDNRYGQGVHIIDPESREVWRIDFTNLHRSGESYSWYGPGGEPTGVDYPGYSPRTLRKCSRKRGGFKLSSTRGKFGKEWAILLVPEEQETKSDLQRRRPEQRR
ncbi:competence protein CoiA [Nocardiopsis metallicus]|uniref:competence protein CoiA n=1 Tax=Nocardiopsis metallicus TaxID=179819 RepID=UPI00161347BB|nr:competence protein CoiA family protein [Nocardiopsis metallicus]